MDIGNVGIAAEQIRRLFANVEGFQEIAIAIASIVFVVLVLVLFRVRFFFEDVESPLGIGRPCLGGFLELENNSLVDVARFGILCQGTRETKIGFEFRRRLGLFIFVLVFVVIVFAVAIVLPPFRCSAIDSFVFFFYYCYSMRTSGTIVVPAALFSLSFSFHGSLAFAIITVAVVVVPSFTIPSRPKRFVSVTVIGDVVIVVPFVLSNSSVLSIVAVAVAFVVVSSLSLSGSFFGGRQQRSHGVLIGNRRSLLLLLVMWMLLLLIIVMRTTIVIVIGIVIAAMSIVLVIIVIATAAIVPFVSISVATTTRIVVAVVVVVVPGSPATSRPSTHLLSRAFVFGTVVQTVQTKLN